MAVWTECVLSGALAGSMCLVDSLSGFTTTIAVPQSGLPKWAYWAMAGGVVLLVLLLVIEFVAMRKPKKVGRARFVDISFDRAPPRHWRPT